MNTSFQSYKKIFKVFRIPVKQEDEEYISLSTGRIHPSTINVVRTTDALNNEQ